MKSTSILLLICLLVWIGDVESRSRNGVYSSSFVFLTARNPTTNKEVRMCANYLQYQIRPIAATAKEAHPYNLQFWDNKFKNLDVCNHLSSNDKYEGSVVPLNYRIIENNSTGSQRCVDKYSKDFRNATQFEVDQLAVHNASAALLVIDKGLQYMKSWRDFLFSDFTDPYVDGKNAIPTFFVYRNELMEKVLSLDPSSTSPSPSIELLFHRPSSSQWDASMLIIWLLAVGAVTGGGFWAYHRHNSGDDDPSDQISWFTDDKQRLRGGKDENKSMNASSEPSEGEQHGCCTRHANTFAILILMAVLISILMLGYFFRPVLIVIFNIFLVVLGSFAVYGCVNALFSNFQCISPSCCFTPLCTRFPEMGCISHRPSLYSLLLYTLCFSLCVCWFIFRNTPYAWILLDFINFTMCLHILKSLRLPSLKWITGLMICMFVYDAFMVFLTPYLTPSGCSVMLQVATGLDCSASQGTGYPTPPIDSSLPEKFPMLMQVMHFDPMLECVDVDVERGYQMTILGLGDIIIPGYLVSHCFTMGGFEAKTRLIYGIICSLGYGIGLIVTFFALTAMGIAQPALIYLVPFTLIPVAVAALIKGDLKKMWHGANDKKDITRERLTPPNSDAEASSTTLRETPSEQTVDSETNHQLTEI